MITEPTSGTDTLSLKTVAKKDPGSGSGAGGDEYVVDGQKLWTSRAEHSDLMILLARTTPREAAASRTEGLSVFLVDMKEALAAGTLTIRPIDTRSEEHTSELQSLMRISYAVFCLTKNKKSTTKHKQQNH